ncbi:uncharacterized protein [Apostichopus japonicus]|uniref:uncharacterized protein n=1 Tax=Stichopus japonicus TaxID=307972 RepID=UPI003AB8ECA3
MEEFHLYSIILKITIFASIALNAANSQELGTPKSGGNNQEASYFFYQRSEYPRDCAEVKAQCSNNNSSGVFVIRPEGFDEPFEVFCENEVDGGGWTVIQRRVDGSINFDRSWSDYKEGFGFLRSEFWIGNQKLSFLTNQKKYQLRIDFENSAGSSFFATYEGFRISDEFSKFRIVSVGQSTGTVDSFIETCPSNMVFKNCSCQTSCENPDVCEDTCSAEDDESCICPGGYFIKGDTCVPPEACGCYLTGRGVIPDGGSYVNDDCTERCSCESGTLICDSSFRCDANAVCEERSDTFGCHCREGFEGDGENCTRNDFTDCYDVYTSGLRNDGVYNIKPAGWPGSEFEVYCEMSNGGGWTVFQRRQDGSVGFYRNWNIYKNGFPDTATGELWLGNEKLYYLTNQKSYKMRIDLVNRDGVSYNLNYDAFRINNEANNYRLETLGSFTGNTGYDYMAYHRRRGFSTHVVDNDGYYYHHCGAKLHSGWWYNDNNHCYDANLNGVYNSSKSVNGVALYNRGANTYTSSLRFTEMKIRPV